MREVLAAAPVGNDAYREDEAVRSLEERVADLFGMESALFLPTGTMANLVAVSVLCPRGGEVLADQESYVLASGLGGLATVAGLQSRTIPAARGVLDPAAVRAALRPAGWGVMATSSLVVENTHARSGGAVVPFPALSEISRLAREHGVGLHCDGARIWHAAVATGTPLRAYGALFDTLTVSVSKGLGAPVGALMLGDTERAERARHLRKQFGGGWRGAGVLAAAAEFAVLNNVARLREDHDKATAIAARLGPESVVNAPVETNIVLVRVHDSTVVHRLCARQGVGVFRLAPDLIRIVTHRDISMEQSVKAAEVIAAVVTQKPN
jgi:threonine aldolase